MKWALPWRVRALTAAIALNLCGGSLYSLGVLLRAFEDSTGIGRTVTALGFSLAAASFLGGVLSAPATGKVMSIARQPIVAGLVAMMALVAAAQWLVVPLVLAASAIMYGWCCGQFYSVALSAVRRSGARSLGLATGVTVASFAVGSAAWSFLIAAATIRWGLFITCTAMGLGFALCGVVAGAMLCDAPNPAAQTAASPPTGPPMGAVMGGMKLWMGFFAISTAGLAVISQAAALADSTMFLSAASLTALIGLSNGAGRVLGGAIADRVRAPLLLAGVSAAAAMTLAMVATGDGGAIAVGGVLVALAYGAGSAAYPAALMGQCSVVAFPRSFARLFTAWGLAAILAPPLMASWVLSSGSYTGVLLAIAALNLIVGLVLCASRSRVARSN